MVSVALMQWWLMPTVSSWCGRWLDPVDGAGLRISLRGAAVAVIVYAASLTVFATVSGPGSAAGVVADRVDGDPVWLVELVVIPARRAGSWRSLPRAPAGR